METESESSSTASSSSSSSASSAVGQVRVRLIAHESLSALSSSKFPTIGPYALPSSAGRHDLSQLVNSELSASSSAYRIYDFLVRLPSSQKIFLRSSLQKFLRRHALLEEHEIVLEYLQMLPPPKEDKPLPHPDWISSLDCRVWKENSQASAKTLVLSGCFDGAVRVMEFDSAVSSTNSSTTSSTTSTLSTGVGHSSAVKGVRFFSPFGESADGSHAVLFVTASKDRTLRLWHHSSSSSAIPAAAASTSKKKTAGDFLREKAAEGSGRCAALTVLQGATESVETVDCVDGFVAAGGWDRKIYLWKIEQQQIEKSIEEYSDKTDGTEEGQEKTNSRKKKQKIEKNSAVFSSSSSLPSLSPYLSLTGHSDAVLAVHFPISSTIYSASMDHSIRHWDVSSESTLSTWNAKTVATALAHALEPVNLLLSAHADGSVKGWDPRVSQNEVLRFTWRSHGAWCSAVTACADDSNIFASASYDGTVKVWDVRSNLPLHTLIAKDKQMAVQWTPSVEDQPQKSGEKGLVSGGADSQLRRWKIEGTAQKKTTVIAPAKKKTQNESNAKRDAEDEHEEEDNMEVEETAE